MPVDDGEEEEAASSALGGPLAGAFRLAGENGQVLSHVVDLWLKSPDAGCNIDALLRLQPRPAAGDGKRFPIIRKGPLGPSCETWEEVPMVELPHLLRLMLRASSAGTVATSKSAEPFLVNEEEESLVFHAWRRASIEAGSEPLRRSLDFEQLLWYDTASSLSEMSACAEAPVPLGRIRLVENSVANREDILGSGPEEAAADEDSSRIEALIFLRRYLSAEAINGDVLPNLFSESRGTVRVCRAELAPSVVGGSGNQDGSIAPKCRPRSIDDLLGEDVDYRKPAPWAVEGMDDPLVRHDLTSVFLLAEHTGFLICCHCLQLRDEFR